MFNRNQIKQKLTKHRAICECAQCNEDYECSIYDAAKSKVGHLCFACKTQISSLTEITQQALLNVFEYNPNTGDLLCKNDSLSGLQGDPVGYAHSQGYLSVAVGGSEYLVHRIIWLMQTGSWPVQIDHINHDRADNRWRNLREVESRDNQLNMGLRKNNSSGVQGIRVLPSGKFHAYIMVNRKQIALGSYDDIDEAISARKQAEIRYGFHKNHGSRG